MANFITCDYCGSHFNIVENKVCPNCGGRFSDDAEYLAWKIKKEAVQRSW